MFSQLFGEYLVEKQVINRDVLEDIIKSQMQVRVKLGMIAVAESMLTEQQAEEINHLQTQFDKRFGDIAVEKGYLTQDQVSALLAKQGSPFMKFLQLLTEKSNVKVSKIDTYLGEFQKIRGFSDEEMKALQCDDLDAIVPVFAFSAKPYVTELTALILRNITRFVTTDFYIEKIKPVEDYKYTALAGQIVTGDHHIVVAFGAESETSGILTLASEYAKENLTEINSAVFDSIGEFTNICSGLLAADLSEKKVDIDMLPPFAYIDQAVKGRGYIIPIYLHGKRLDLFLAADSGAEPGTTPYQVKIEKKAGSKVTADSKGTVLIVDDSALIRKTLRDLVENLGYTVVGEAINGAEAIEEYRSLKPGIVTLDITMPVMDGVEALKEIKKIDPSAKVVMITAAGQQNKVIEALKVGAAKFIIKPFSKDEVAETFKEILG